VLEHTNKKLQYLTSGLLVLSPSITFTLIMCSRLLITNTKITDENTGDIGWIYESIPIESKRIFLNGILKFINYNFIIPVVFLITFLLFMRIEPLPALLNILYITTFLFFINSTLKLFDKKYPFTLESSKFNSASKFLEILFTLILGIIVFICQIFIFQNVIFVIISIVILSGLTILFNKIKTS
jgi:hypothetical protein